MKNYGPKDGAECGSHGNGSPLMMLEWQSWNGGDTTSEDL